MAAGPAGTGSMEGGSEISLGVRLSGDFTLSGTAVKLELDDVCVKWSSQKSDSLGAVAWDDVITVYLGAVSRGPGVKGDQGEVQSDRFTLHYMEHQKLNLLRHKHVTFQGQKDELQRWVDGIGDKTGKDRPKRLLTLVNPIGGQQKGQQLYHSVVEPLFHLAGIETELIVTERFRHAEEVARTYDFNKVDGMLVSGGDGLMQEVLHSLIPRYNEGVNLDDPEIEVKPLPFTLGALPTGTGNGISMACHGCTDLETGALVAIRGKKRYLHIASVHELPGRLLGYSCTTLGYGFWADLLRKTDGSRWLKTLRYQATMVRQLASRKREFSVQGEYLPAQRPNGDQRLHEDESKGWIKFSGRYTGIYGMIGGFHNMTGNPKLQMKPAGPGINLLLEKQTGRFTYFKWLMSLAKLKSDMFEADHVEEHYVKAYKFHVVEPEEGVASEEEQGNKELEHDVSFEGEFRRTETKSLDVRVQPRITEFYATTFTEF